MIEAVQSAATATNCNDRVHVEFFSGAGAANEAEFELELVRSARIVPVAKGQTMLEALRAAGVEISSSCEGGVCLECRTRYLDGFPIHRDLVMNSVDRREFVTPCVSGCSTNRLVLDL
jgi:ferredoxin